MIALLIVKISRIGLYEEAHIDWENTMIITKRYMHDDWDRIFEKMSKQIESKFT